MNAELKTTKRVTLKKLVISGKSFLQFDFKGHLDMESALAAINDWKQQLSTNQKTNLIYNCVDMTGFDTSARKAWQSALSELKSNTGSIWIISTNAFILGAAKTMGLLSGYDIKISKTMEGVKS